MPLYDFKCECGVDEERVVMYDKRHDQICDKCGKPMTCLLDISRVNFREFKPQVIEALHPTKEITSFGEMKRLARSWEGDEERKLLVDCAPTQAERKRKLDMSRQKHSEADLKKKNGGNLITI